MGTHTPGPWMVGPVDDTLVRAVSDEGEYIDIADILGDYDDPVSWPFMEANARLIAAAPDLLEALKDAVEFSETVDFPLSPTTVEMIEKWETAIAKATGAA